VSTHSTPVSTNPPRVRAHAAAGAYGRVHSKPRATHARPCDLIPYDRNIAHKPLSITRASTRRPKCGRLTALPYTLRRGGGPRGIACLQLAKIEDGGSDAEQELLIAVKAENPDASPTELRRLFQVSSLPSCQMPCSVSTAPGLGALFSGPRAGGSVNRPTAACICTRSRMGSELPHPNPRSGWVHRQQDRAHLDGTRPNLHSGMGSPRPGCAPGLGYLALAPPARRTLHV
jgi:hypothetical protein